MRNESRTLIDQLAASERQAESLISQNELIVGDATGQSLAKGATVEARDSAPIRKNAARLARVKAKPG